MEHMKDLFPYLWLLNSYTNSLLEPNELTRELLEGAEAFRAKLAGLRPEELAYAQNDIRAAHTYLKETRELLVKLEQSLADTGLLEGGETA